MSSVFDNERFRKLLRTQPWEALLTLYEQYSDTLFKIAVKLTRNDSIAFDVVQDTFMTIWENRKSLSKMHEKSIEYYLARIVRNKAVDYYKRRRHADIDVVMLFVDFHADDDIIGSIIAGELYSEFREQILKLPPREQEVIIMKIDRQMSLDEIAGKLNISRKMVEKIQTQAIKSLKKWAGTRRS
jgi:RNA polymerase sigma-70 factor, ECF subfamily